MKTKRHGNKQYLLDDDYTNKDLLSKYIIFFNARNNSLLFLVSSTRPFVLLMTEDLRSSLSTIYRCYSNQSLAQCRPNKMKGLRVYLCSIKYMLRVLVNNTNFETERVLSIQKPYWNSFSHKVHAVQRTFIDTSTFKVN